MNHKNNSQGTDVVERIIRQLAPANENLTGNVLKQFWQQTRSKNKYVL